MLYAGSLGYAMNGYTAVQVAGACIQCYHRGCYTAFHVSCARYRRCYMSERVEWDRTHPDSPAAAFGPSVCYCPR
jgi:hypothetical protein